jgi:hypothetical protein
LDSYVHGASDVGDHNDRASTAFRVHGEDRSWKTPLIQLEFKLALGVASARTVRPKAARFRRSAQPKLRYIDTSHGMALLIENGPYTHRRRLWYRT